MIISLFILLLSLTLLALISLPKINIDTSQFTLFEFGFESKTEFGIYNFFLWPYPLSLLISNFLSSFLTWVIVWTIGLPS